MDTQAAVLHVLYLQEPEFTGDYYVAVRQWETLNGECLELVVEHGQLDENGDLFTQCQVMPFHLTLEQVLETVR